MKLAPPAVITEQLKKVWLDTLLPSLRERLFDEKIFERVEGWPSSRKILDVVNCFFKMANLPFIGEWLPEFDPKKSNISWIPINQDIQGAEEIALPEEVLDRLIDKASHRMIVHFCGCRVAMGCKDYPSEIGCLMMGESALQIPAAIRKEVSSREAKAHVRKAIKAGLIPITGKARIDNDFFMIPDEGKLLTVCLCCECCCVTRAFRYLPPEIMKGIQHPVEGLTVEVTDDCNGCGTCLDKCYTAAIELKNGQAVIGDMCAVCGRCAAHCPKKAIKLRLDNPNAVDDVVSRIESVIDL